MLTHIVAVGEHNNVIGSNNKLPWSLPEDLKRFKKITTGNTVIMGRKTFESIGKALQDRTNIVMTRQWRPTIGPHYEHEESLPKGPSNIIVTPSLLNAINHSKDNYQFIIGGQEVYEQSITLVDYIFLTIVKGNFNGDRFYPQLPDYFRLEYAEDFDTHKFIVWRSKKASCSKAVDMLRKLGIIEDTNKLTLQNL